MVAELSAKNSRELSLSVVYLCYHKQHDICLVSFGSVSSGVHVLTTHVVPWNSFRTRVHLISIAIIVDYLLQ